MGQFLYEKPREKLLRAGVAALTNVELLQVVIGSGSSGASVRQLARKINKLLTKRELQWSPDDLLALKGIGLAKAGVIIAAIELASRFITTHQGQVYSKQEDFLHLISRIAPSSNPTVWVYMFDGASRLVGRSDIRYEQNASGEYLAARMLREVVWHNAVNIYIAFTKTGHSETLSIEELSAIRGILNAGKFMALDVKGIAVVLGDRIVQYDKGAI